MTYCTLATERDDGDFDVIATLNLERILNEGLQSDIISSINTLLSLATGELRLETFYRQDSPETITIDD
jgi:hypothetical protein